MALEDGYLLVRPALADQKIEEEKAKPAVGTPIVTVPPAPPKGVAQPTTGTGAGTTARAGGMGAGAGRSTMLGCIGEGAFLQLQSLVFVGIDDLGRIELIELKPVQRMIGSSGLISRSCFDKWSPVMKGMVWSVITRSKAAGFLRKASSASRLLVKGEIR